jgi:hypothetical protein
VKGTDPFNRLNLRGQTIEADLARKLGGIPSGMQLAIIGMARRFSDEMVSF